MVGRPVSLVPVFIALLSVAAVGRTEAVLARLTRLELNEALKLGRAPEEEWREFMAEWRLDEDSLRTRPVRRVEVWTPFNRIAFGAREANLKGDQQYRLRAPELQRRLVLEYREEIVFVVSYVVRQASRAEEYRAELRPEEGDTMGPIGTEVLASFRWAGEYQRVHVKYSFPKLLLGDWEGPVSLFLVPPRGEADGPWTFDLSKLR